MSISVSSELIKNTQHIISGGMAFVGYTNDEGLVAWGASKKGGDSSGVVGEFKYCCSNFWCVCRSEKQWFDCCLGK